MEKVVLKDPNKTNYMFKSLGKILLTITIIISSLFLLLILISKIFESNWKNPLERNFIVFQNINKNQVIDSVDKFMEMIKTYPFQLDTIAPYSLVINNFVNGDGHTFKINGKRIKDFSFREIRRSDPFSKFSNEQIITFISLYKYLFNIGLDFGMYDSKTKYFYFGYKDLYYMYFDPEIPDDANRTLAYYNGEKTEYLYHRIILDHYRGFYLTCNGDDTTSTHIPYKMLEKFKK
jgi:hypothetical protein